VIQVAKTSICICTRNRPDELRKCLLSIAQSSIPVGQVIVSDDSTDDSTYQMIRTEFGHVQYTRGPRIGLGANRNHAVRRANLDYVLFLDDDARLGSRFLESARDCLVGSGDPRRTIVTGLEDRKYKNGERLLAYAHDQDFLGFQRVPYKPGQTLNTISIGNALIPRALFDELSFDDLLVYGYDEVDLATRAKAKGFDILQCGSALNFHFPSEINRDYYRPFIEASRLYATYKRYAITDKKPAKGAVYLLVAIVHLLLSSIKRRGVVGPLEALNTLKVSFGYLQSLTRSPKDSSTRIHS
jgi:GT2 family glycosyltransferase